MLEVNDKPYMHCNIVKLTDKLGRQAWITRYMGIDFSVGWYGNLLNIDKYYVNSWIFSNH